MGHIQKRKKFQKRNFASWRFEHEMKQITKTLHDAILKWFDRMLAVALGKTFQSFPAPASETGVESYDTAQKFSDCEHGA
jgi:hypothetical protein